MTLTTFEDLQKTPQTSRIFIVGGGIAGCALACYLSQSDTGKQIVVLDKSLTSLLGSTASAPGLVGQVNASAVLTTLAKESVQEFTAIPGGYDAVGGLEIASTPAGVETLNERLQLAREAGLPAEILTAEKAAALAPEFVKVETVSAALHFPSDGTSNPGPISDSFRRRAQEHGALFVEAAVTGLEAENGVITGISTSNGVLPTGSNQVILATGIWTLGLLSSFSSATIPIIPVAHPYTFTPPHPPRPGKPYPFVRWPEEHVYARDHGDCDGLGSYNHSVVRTDQPLSSAVGEWDERFETALSRAAETCLKNGRDFLTQGGYTARDAAAQRKPFNGTFSVTPDNLPFAGKSKLAQNLWLCAAVWVTHVAGTAKLVVREILRDQNGDTPSREDQALLESLDPDRFLGGDKGELTRQAMSRYNDIYNSQPVE